MVAPRMPVSEVFIIGFEYLLFNMVILLIGGAMLGIALSAPLDIAWLFALLGFTIVTTGYIGLTVKAIADGVSYALYHNKNIGQKTIPTKFKLVSRTADPNSSDVSSQMHVQGVSTPMPDLNAKLPRKNTKNPFK